MPWMVQIASRQALDRLRQKKREAPPPTAVMISLHLAGYDGMSLLSFPIEATRRTSLRNAAWAACRIVSLGLAPPKLMFMTSAPVSRASMIESVAVGTPDTRRPLLQPVRHSGTSTTHRTTGSSTCRSSSLLFDPSRLMTHRYSRLYTRRCPSGLQAAV